MGTGEKTVTIMNFLFEVAIISSICYLLLRIMDNSIKKLQEEAKNEE